MRKTKLSVIAMLAMMGVIGMAWALFDFNTPVSGSADIGILLEGYTSIGEIEFEVGYYFNETRDYERRGIAIDNAADISHHYAEVTVFHWYPNDGELPANGVVYYGTAEFMHYELLRYFYTDATITSDWEHYEYDGPFKIMKATYKISIDWVPGMAPTNIAEWRELNDTLETLHGYLSSDIKFTLEIVEGQM